jgi:hypothetical protein
MNVYREPNGERYVLINGQRMSFEEWKNLPPKRSREPDLAPPTYDLADRPTGKRVRLMPSGRILEFWIEGTSGREFILENGKKAYTNELFQLFKAKDGSIIEVPVYGGQ